ncbi:hypothetical protein H6F51_14395 [Cyanobacteria bacterium FACHB-DQ100]|nr:hypothetical protein [Cyanobacteria bacterium FACHB-DQ100]
MELASFRLPEFKHFDPIGLKFNATSKKLGSEQVYFWIPPINEKSDRLFRWIPKSSSWKECPIAGLSEKKRAALLECWKNQSDIGLWMTHQKRLNQFKSRAA